MGCEFAADDYGISGEINEGILDLSRRRVISKISVMPGAYAISLDNQTPDNVQTGLHVTLTLPVAGNDNKDTSPTRLFYRCYIKRELNIENLIDTVLRQAAFVESRGIRISYLDTHQHVHVMPKLLTALIIVAKRKGIKIIRCITIQKRHLPFYFYSLIRYGFIMQVPKYFILYAMGFLMKRSLDKQQMQYPENLILMPMALHGDYAGLLKSFYRRFKDKNAEIITHPGFMQDAGFDEYVEGRKIEYEALSAFACNQKTKMENA